MCVYEIVISWGNSEPPIQNFLFSFFLKKREHFLVLLYSKKAASETRPKKKFIIMHLGAMRLAPIAAPKVEQQGEPMR